MNTARNRFAIVALLLPIFFLGCKRAAPHPYANLDAKTLRTLSGDDLESAIEDYVASKLDKNYEHEYEIVTGLPKGVQAIYTTAVLEAEVANGGFNQYYWNTDGKFRKQALEGFRLIGANAHADLVEEANSIYEKQQAKLNQYKQKGTTQAFSDSYNDNPLNPLDDRFYKLKDDLRSMWSKFVREHPELFFGQ